jgi:hypothetical protein
MCCGKGYTRLLDELFFFGEGWSVFCVASRYLARKSGGLGDQVFRKYESRVYLKFGWVLRARVTRSNKIHACRQSVSLHLKMRNVVWYQKRTKRPKPQ